MAYASKSGRARTSASNPEAFGVCDRCSMWYNLRDLRWQMDWRGASLMNIRLLVCNDCYDDPQQQLRAIVVPADPVPVVNPRIEPFATDETNYRVTSGQNTTNFFTGIPVPGGNTRTTQDDNTRVTQQTGEPNGGLNTQPGTDPNAPGNNNPGLPYNNTTVPKTGPLT
jgi:hypothetical protein